MHVWATENLHEIMETLLHPRSAWCGMLSWHVVSSKSSFSSPSVVCQFLGNIFFNRIELDCIQQMQCWMFSMSIFIIKFCLINLLHVLDMESLGQHFNLCDFFLWECLNDAVSRNSPHTIQEISAALISISEHTLSSWKVKRR